MAIGLLILFNTYGMASDGYVQTPEQGQRSDSLHAHPDVYKQVSERIRSIVARHFGVPPGSIAMAVPLERQNIQADELDIVEIIMEVEAAFVVTISNKDLNDHTDSVISTISIKSLADVVYKKKIPSAE